MDTIATIENARTDAARYLADTAPEQRQANADAAIRASYSQRDWRGFGLTDAAFQQYAAEFARTVLDAA